MTEPRFVVGQRVRIADRTPPLHHRVPSYAKGRTGVIERVSGMHPDPERCIRGDGKPFQRIYRVCIPQSDLWDSYDGSDGDNLEIDVFEHWLEDAK